MKREAITINLGMMAEFLGSKIQQFAKNNLGNVDIPPFAYDNRFLVSVAMATLESKAKEHLEWFNGDLSFDKKLLENVNYFQDSTVGIYEAEFNKFARRITAKKIGTLGDIWEELFPWYINDDVTPAASAITPEVVAQLKVLSDQSELDLQLHLGQQHDLAPMDSAKYMAYRSANILAKTNKDAYLKTKNQITRFSAVISDSGTIGYFRNLDEYITYTFNIQVVEQIMQVAEAAMTPIMHGDKWNYWVVKQHSGLVALYENQGNWLLMRALDLYENGHKDLFLC